MRKFSWIITIVGGCLIWFGVQEYRVGRESSSEPVPVELADLEADEARPDNHIRIGLNHHMFAGVVIEYESKDGRMRPSSKVNWIYTPLISDTHPYMQKIHALEKKYGSLEKVPKNADWPALGKFVVLVKSEAYKTVKDIPRKRTPYKSVTGLVVNLIDPLDDKAKRLIRKGIPNIDFDKVLVVEHGRKPTSVAGSIGIITAGALLVLLSVGLMLRRPGRKPAEGPADETAAPPEPPPSEADDNPYSGD